MTRPAAPPELRRRTFVVATGALVLGCRSRGEPPPERTAPATAPTASAATSGGTPPAPAPPSVPDDVVLEERRFVKEEGGPQKMVVGRPSWSTGADKLPVLIALHGRGEAQKGMEAGASGWWRDYALDRAYRRLRSPPLLAADFLGFVTPERLGRLNASLEKRPFRGLVVASPYTPDLLSEKTLDNAGPFARFLVERALPALREDTRVDPSRAATGIDGVSLGGRVALLVGFARADVFGAVGSLQAAIQSSEARELARRAKSATEKGALRLRLVTSERDFYREEIGLFDKELTRAGVDHEHLVLPGPHDYPWNRGPGALEMLLWHDRVLRGEAPL